MLNCVIDISHWQKVFDFDKIKNAGIVGVIHKATESLSNLDEKYANRKQAFIDRGFLFGSYHFLRRDGIKEANRFLDIVKPTDTELICLDAEAQNLTVKQLITESENFVSQIYEKTGRYPVLYIGNFILNDYAKGIGFRENTPLVNCPLWIARYSTKEPIVPKPFSDWSLWQYTDSSIIPGITTVDRNRFNGTKEQLFKFWNAESKFADNTDFAISDDDFIA